MLVKRTGAHTHRHEVPLTLHPGKLAWNVKTLGLQRHIVFEGAWFQVSHFLGSAGSNQHKSNQRNINLARNRGFGWVLAMEIWVAGSSQDSHLHCAESSGKGILWRGVPGALPAAYGRRTDGSEIPAFSYGNSSFLNDKHGFQDAIPTGAPNLPWVFSLRSLKKRNLWPWSHGSPSPFHGSTWNRWCIDRWWPKWLWVNINQ